MLTVLSPAKTLNFEKKASIATASPKFRKESAELVGILKKKSPKDLIKLMSISDKLAELNHERFQNFSSRYSASNSRAALLAFKGDVYLGLQAEDFDQKDLAYAQEHLRILSGLYGILKPLDKMQPYRLEMGTALKNDKGNNLYDFWDDKITKEINKELKSHKDPCLVNLASKEYFKAIKKKDIKADIIDVHFKEYRDGKLKFVSFNAKKARGLMARYIIKERIDHREGLKGFNLDSYHYEASLSDEKNLHFVR